MRRTSHLENIQNAAGTKLDLLLVAYSTRARLAAVEGFDEACHRAGVRIICDQWAPDPPPHRLFCYSGGECVAILEISFDEYVEKRVAKGKRPKLELVH